MLKLFKVALLGGFHDVIIFFGDEDVAGFKEVGEDEVEILQKLLDLFHTFVHKQELENLIEVGNDQGFELVEEIFESFLEIFAAEQFDLFLQGCGFEFPNLDEVVFLEDKKVFGVFNLLEEHIGFHKPLQNPEYILLHFLLLLKAVHLGILSHLLSQQQFQPIALFELHIIQKLKVMAVFLQNKVQFLLDKIIIFQPHKDGLDLFEFFIADIPFTFQQFFSCDVVSFAELLYIFIWFLFHYHLLQFF